VPNSEFYIYHSIVYDVTNFINAKIRFKYKGKAANLTALMNYMAFYCQDGSRLLFYIKYDFCIRGSKIAIGMGKILLHAGTIGTR